MPEAVEGRVNCQKRRYRLFCRLRGQCARLAIGIVGFLDDGGDEQI